MHWKSDIWVKVKYQLKRVDAVYLSREYLHDLQTPLYRSKADACQDTYTYLLQTSIKLITQWTLINQIPWRDGRETQRKPSETSAACEIFIPWYIVHINRGDDLKVD